MIQFYSPDLEESLSLPESESHHCVRVLRHKRGEEITVTDGKGNRFRCLITSDNPKKTEISIIDKEYFPRTESCFMTLAVAPTKSADRMEWMAEKVVELGVGRIVLLRCERSERKSFRLDRLEKVVVSAMKQSLGVWMPEVLEVTRFRDFLESVPDGTQKFFGYCSPEYPLKEFAREYKAGKDVAVMIGPEGDFSPNEVKEAVDRGFLPVTFGDRRLRTETAAVFAVCAVDVLNRV